jgi:crotonobetainyl-CoA:carnitine CoA-transferase CaiB-like acyl-CoA transferase
MKPGALAGIKVIDLTSYLSGPYCTMILGDLGADVIKIERAGEGDEARRMPPHINGESVSFMITNRNKRSVALDLKDPAQLKQCFDLIADADVMVENFRPGVIDRLGLGYEALSKVNPRLVFCSISGFGQNGPLRDRGGFDLMTQAMSGLMSVNGPEDGPPYRMPVAISDVTTGMFAAIAILGALTARGQSGRGQKVEAALYDSAVAMGLYEAAQFFATGLTPARLGQGHRGGVPYQVFRTSDGWMTVGASSQKHWERFCGVLGCTELLNDERFTTNILRVENRRELIPLLEPLMSGKPNAHWMRELEAVGIPAGPVQTYDQVYRDPQVLEREMVVEMEHPKVGTLRVLGVPFKLSDTPAGIRRRSPRLGEHTAEVLSALPAAKPGDTP